MNKKQKEDVINVDGVCLVCGLPLNICICQNKVKVVQDEFIYKKKNNSRTTK